MRTSILALTLCLFFSVSLKAEETKENVDKDGKDLKPPKTLMLFGDEIISGYKIPKSENLATQLQEVLKENKFNAITIDEGIFGDNSVTAARRVKKALKSQELEIDAALIIIGGNDLQNVKGFNAEKAQRNISKIVEAFIDADINIILAGMKAPLNRGRPIHKKFNTIYPAIAEEYNIDLYPLFLKKVTRNLELMMYDDIRSRKKGVRLLAEHLAPKMIRLLKRK